MQTPIAFKTLAAFVLGAAIMTTPAQAEHHGGAKQPNIVQAAASNDQFSTLVTAVQAADLADTLSGEGPFTVFAPTNSAFEKLPDGTVATLLRAENKADLQTVLTYHVVAGKVSSDDLIHLIHDGDGHARIDTIAGEQLIARISGESIILTDGAGRATRVTMADLDQSNGVIHVLDGVLLPG